MADEERKRPLEADNSDGDGDSDPEEGRIKRRRAAGKRTYIAEHDSDDDSDGEEEYIPGGAKKTSARKSAAPAMVESAGESSSDDSDDEFHHMYDENGYGDENDRAALMKLNEAERELELARRFEERERDKERWEIKQRLKRDRKLASREDKSRVQPRRQKSKATTKKEKALKELKASRKREMERQSRQRQMSDDDEESEDLPEEDDDDDDDFNEQSTSRKRGTRYASADVSSDEGDFPPDFDSPPATFEEIGSIRLSRHKLVRWCHEPFFDKTVKGCFVRIFVGKNSETQMPTYRLVQVVGSEDGPKKYTIDGTRTNKVLIVRHGVHERPFRIEFVSNQPPTDSEVRGWHKSVLDHNLTLPTKADVEAALAQIEQAKSHSHTSEEVREMIARKRSLGAARQNYAIRKEEIERQISHATETGNVEAVRRLEDELRDIDRRSRMAAEIRTKALAGVNVINERNRKANIAERDYAAEAAKEAAAAADPFTRRMTRMIQVSGKKAATSTPDKQGGSETGGDANAAAGSGKPSPLLRRKSTEEVVAKSLLGARRSSAGGELFDSHADLELNLDDLDLPPPNVPPPAASSASASGARRTPGRSLNLAEYKKQRGLI